MARMSPTQRTLAYYRGLGYTVGIVEKWNHHIQRRQDLFGFVDLFAFNESEVLFIQATSGSNTSARVTKILDNEHAIRWMESGRKIIVIGWRELVAYKKDGTKAKRKKWTPKIIEVQG